MKGLSGTAAPELHASDVDVADTADGPLAARSMGLRTDHVELHHPWSTVEYRGVPSVGYHARGAVPHGIPGTS